MLNFVYEHDDLITKFVATLVPDHGRGFGKCRTIGVIDEEGRLIAGLIYHNYDPEAEVIEISGAATDRRWLNRATLKRMFEYPFVDCSCQMVVMRVRADNEHLLRILAAYDFSFTLMPRLYGRGDDGVLCTLTDDAWLSNKFSKRFYEKLKKAA